MLFKEATTYVCVYIYISRTREKKEIVLFLGSLPPPPSPFQECEFYNHASLCTSLIRFIFIGYRFPPSPLRHFYAIREIRVRETTRSSTEIFLCTINIPLSLSRSIRDEDTGFHRFPSPPFPIRGSKICRAKGKSNPAYQYLYLDPSIADHPGEADLHRFTRDSKDGVGGEFWIWLVEKDLAAKGTRKGGEERGKGTRGEVPSRSNKNIYIAFSM